MTLRELFGWTKHMGVFEISVAWLILPTELKDKVPEPTKTALNNLATAIATYQVAVLAYTTAKKAYDDALSALTGPPGITELAMRKAMINADTLLRATIFSPIEIVLDTPIT